MMATRSEMWRTTARLWEMNRYDRPTLSLSSTIRFTIWAWMDTSSAAVASSATTNPGRSARARAMTIR